MPLATFRLGRRAERHAARVLRRRGFTILQKNVRLGRDEIDLVALDGDTLVAVEVRYRSRGLGDAVESITPDKRRSLLRALRALRRRERLLETHSRIDLVAVTREGWRWRSVHVRGVVDEEG